MCGDSEGMLGEVIGMRVLGAPCFAPGAPVLVLCLSVEGKVDTCQRMDLVCQEQTGVGSHEIRFIISEWSGT